jgi:C-terminal processing protease CtpA/Prc
MNIFAFRVAVVFTLFAASAPMLSAAVNGGTGLQQAMEIISVLRSNYVDRDQLNDKLLDSATVDGILRALGQGAVIVPAEAASTNVPPAPATEPKPSEPLARAEVIDPDIGYLRLADVTAEAVPALDAELKRLTQEKVGGFILDLRFADGTNYAAAAAVASRFLSGSQELFTLKSSEKSPQVFRASPESGTASAAAPEPISAPLMLLANAETRGSAEALVGALRMQDRAIVIGAKTGGSAAGWKDVKLNDGQTLRLATAKIVFPSRDDGVAAGIDLFPNGVTPDVKVKIDPKVEREVVFSLRTNETLTASLQPRIQKKILSEAELVKAFRGQAADTALVSTNRGSEEENEIQNVRDVVLQRAVDILKGIRVLLSWQ